MKKIAILACLNSNNVCAGCGCLKAFNHRTAHFEAYAGTELELCAFMRCSHCGVDPLTDPGMMEKLERLVKTGVETAHIGVCAKKKDCSTCPYMQAVADWLTEHGIQVVWGTH